MKAPIPTTLQQFSPKDAHFCIKIENFITSILHTPLCDTKLLVALSGGVDSCALLLALNALSKRCNFSIVAAHFNHKLRPEADHEEIQVKELCQTLSIDIVTDSQDVSVYASQHKLGIEEAARTLRYNFLQKSLIDTCANWIVTAHHANDLAEDVVMRLIRGTGWPALGGMEGKCNNRKILRPFLHTPKSSIIAFAKSTGLTWCEDKSNTDENFLRNRVRSQIIPLLCKENPAFLDSITSLWDLAQIDAGYWKQILDPILSDTPTEQPVLFKEDLLTMPQAMRLRLYKAILTGMGKGQPLQSNLLALDNAWQSNVGGKIIQFPGNKSATIKKGSIYFSNQ